MDFDFATIPDLMQCYFYFCFATIRDFCVFFSYFILYNVCPKSSEFDVLSMSLNMLVAPFLVLIFLYDVGAKPLLGI